MEKKQVTVGAKEGLGAGVVAIALLMIFLPMMSQRIADLEFIQSDAFAILSGSILVLSIFTAIAGLVVIFSKFDDSEE